MPLQPLLRIKRFADIKVVKSRRIYNIDEMHQNKKASDD